MNGPDPNPSFHYSGTRGLDHTASSTLLASGSSLGFLARGSGSQSFQDPDLAAQVEQAEAHETYHSSSPQDSTDHIRYSTDCGAFASFGHWDESDQQGYTHIEPASPFCDGSDPEFSPIYPSPFQTHWPTAQASGCYPMLIDQDGSIPISHSPYYPDYNDSLLASEDTTDAWIHHKFGHSLPSPPLLVPSQGWSSSKAYLGLHDHMSKPRISSFSSLIPGSGQSSAATSTAPHRDTSLPSTFTPVLNEARQAQDFAPGPHSPGSLSSSLAHAMTPVSATFRTRSPLAQAASCSTPAGLERGGNGQLHLLPAETARCGDTTALAPASRRRFFKRSLKPKPALPRAISPHSKKPPHLACFFCRGRKIACAPLPPGSLEKSCNQCLKRGLECIFPQESHRGQRVQKPKVERSESSQGLLSDEEGGQPKEASMEPAADSKSSTPL